MTSADTTPITASLLSKKTLSARLSLSTRTLENMVATGQFPAGVRIGKFVYWTETVVATWQKRVFGVQEAWRP